MKLHQAIDSNRFLQEDWQKQACVFRKVFSDTQLLISGNELAGLACEEEIESRIIIGSDNDQDWQCQFGPFDGYDYDALGKNNWTLLVQSVDHFIPEVKAILDYFDFIPKWRLDDVMLSYAAPGGGVGPHFDYYDVFLIQISGSRQWKTGQSCDENTQLREHEDMKLLQSFTQTACHELHPGDMIYIPAGVAHWGTATSTDCITASVGFRAPAYQDLMYSAALDISAQFPQHLRYQDTDEKYWSDSYNLSVVADKQFAHLYKSLDQKTFVNALRIAFAKEVTTPRYQDLFEFTEIDESQLALKISSIKKHSHARFVYLQISDTVILFANGLDYITDLQTAQAVCHENFSDSKTYDLETVTELCRQGLLLFS